MRIRYEFDLEKAIAVMAYIVAKIGPMEKVFLSKLVYVANRDHFLRHGYPITGDDQYALQYGPISTVCLDAMAGELDEADSKLFYEHLHISDNTISLRKESKQQVLTKEETVTLDEVISDYLKGPQGWAYVNKTHEFPEYKEVYQPGTSALIPYELILKLCGDESHYRHNRPVISRAVRKHMLNPF